MRNALNDIVEKSCDMVQPKSDEIVLDIGCNDGTLLRSYKIDGLRLVGFEPAKNLVKDARRGTAHVFNDFFTSDLFRQKFGNSKAKIITSIAMFYDINDPNSFVKDIVDCLDSNGIWVVQQNYLGSMLEQNGFDNVGHEHLTYYSLETMKELVEKYDLQIFSAETNDVNGGSFRTYIAHKGRFPLHENLRKMRDYEAHLFSEKPPIYERFQKNIKSIREQLRNFVTQQVEAGKTIYVYGASTRGNTILQYCGLDHRLVKKATDANKEKWGLRTPGTMIPIISKEQARRDNPDFFLILPHHFLTEIINEEKPYLRKGGQFIIPLPEFRVIRNADLASSEHSTSTQSED